MVATVVTGTDSHFLVVIIINIGTGEDLIQVTNSVIIYLQMIVQSKCTVIKTR